MRYNLRTDDEATLQVALRAAGIINQWGQAREGITLDVIGTIYKATGEMEQSEIGSQVPVMLAVPGWHANLIAELSPEQQAILPIIPPPKNPYRVFAGE